MTSRRRFLAAGAALPWGLGIAPRTAAQSPEQFDTLIRGGTLIDPARGMQARADLGIRGGRIASIEPQLPAAGAARVIEANGQYVAPALIDMHAQVYSRQSMQRAPADELAGATGITAWVSAGDVGPDEAEAFKQYSARHSRCRIYAFLHFDRRTAALGIDSDMRIVRAMAQHRDVVLGLKIHVPESPDAAGAAPLERALDLLKRAEMRGRLMCHVASAQDADAILERLRPGDIVTHPFHAGSALFVNGRVRPAALAARNRGVVVDVGHGAQFDVRQARVALEQGFLPDVISSDLRLRASPPLSQPRLTTVMDAFVRLGLTLDQVLAMTTANPARIIGREPHLGTLSLGAPADIVLLKWHGRDAEAARDSAVPLIEPMLTLRSGVPLPRLAGAARDLREAAA